ncbi:hypothetical protein HWN40_00540 [Methanolobus zinderi]|uniref:Uncharacterized protein n=1 Tax=Methanolobus zinderi TaxID=536044 RepID=A0A7D5IAH2_9EURY|nr:hypothetical protein [Methanolobus zinderi]KXS44029.1 MAG: hypothetical protein AWU59_755 [Methanolobus sp. T82-4]QLC48869.1 hypothetical protein HWN40_00540 [Methanolobus zinderi]
MTRITTTREDMPLSTSMDIFHMKNRRDPVDEEVLPFLAIHGNHATINEESVLYDDEEVAHVYTKNVFGSIPKVTVVQENVVEADVGTIYH